MGRLVNAYRGTKKIKRCLIDDKIIFEGLTPVIDGLIEWFDFADGNNTELSLKSRVSDNILTLTNFNFDANSGWTGKGLKFDGVNDYCASLNFLDYFNFLGDFEIECVFTNTETRNMEVIVFGNPELGGFVISSLSTDKSNFKGSIYTDGNYKESSTKQCLNMEVNLVSLAKRNNDVSFRKNLEKSEIGFIFNPNNYKLGARIACIFSNATNNVGQAVGFSKGIIHSIKIYNRALTLEEIQQNYEYEQSIDRTPTMLLPEAPEEKSYMIGLSNQLSEEQLSTFRLSNNKEKFVCGLRYSKDLIGELYTYSEIQKEMEKEEWCCQESIE